MTTPKCDVCGLGDRFLHQLTSKHQIPHVADLCGDCFKPVQDLKHKLQEVWLEKTRKEVKALILKKKLDAMPDPKPEGPDLVDRWVVLIGAFISGIAAALTYFTFS